MRIRISMLLLACFGFIVQSHANDMQLTINEALSIATNQRIQCQRIGRVYMALYNNIMEPSFYQERDLAIATFDKQLRRLSFFTPTPEIESNMEKVKKYWEEYKKIANWSIKKDAGSKLLRLSPNMLEASNNLYNSYLDYHRSQTNTYYNSDVKTINQYLKHNINHQILMERLMMYYLANKQGVEAPGSSATFRELPKTFVRILDILDKAQISSVSIRKDIASIRKEWAGLEHYFINVDNNQEYMKDMFYSVNKIKALLEDIANNYKKLSVKLNLSYSLNEAINQTVLVQAISKAYIASHFDNSSSYQYKKIVTDGVETFERRVTSMLHTAQTEEITTALNVVNVMWKNYKRLVTDFENIDEVRKIRLMELCYVIMASCDRVTDAVEAHARSIPAYNALYIKNGKEVTPCMNIAILTRTASNMAGLSERIALYFMMKAADIDHDLSSKRLTETLNAFSKYFELLNNSSINSPALKTILENSTTEWHWIKETCNNANKENIEQILEHAKQLRKKMLKASVLYAHQMNNIFSQDEQ